ncbi:hypothetical protein [Paenibacillus sp. NEAU-GSW1]|uniref:hypothetical protein n=1 Tax=Paenibacillus sp. NEAU-GSW1 TaxID=2682486 RepID=UPI0012E31014|nr:hypothetical protein [Paenibacillus sp. NEAU-GSW1]MUT68097.1 hypothetical protein [Paenibacillus sp. NEAU-GSW1]
MNSIWEYIVPTFFVACMCAYMATRRGKNAVLWFFAGMVGNVLAAVIIGGAPYVDKDNKDHWGGKERDKTNVMPDKRPGTLTAAGILILVTAGLSGMLGMYQISIHSTSFGLLNLLFMAGGIWLGIQLLKMKAYFFALTLTVLNAAGGLIMLATYGPIYLIFEPLNIAALVCLILNWKVFR